MLTTCKAASLETFRLVSVRDDAIDREAGDLDAYVEDMAYDLRHLHFLPGREPTLFVCRPLSAAQMRAVQDSPVQKADGTALGFGSMVWLAFRCGVQSMENFPAWSDRAIVAGNPALVSEKWINQHLPFEIVQEIGFAILRRSRLGEDDRKNC